MALTQKATKTKRRSISFPLDVDDGWPPVAMECLPFDVVAGGLKLLVPPLFVKKLSVGDVIEVRERLGRVTSWKHKRRSKQSTIWLLRMRGTQRDIKRVLKQLRHLGCETTSLDDQGVHAIAVPPGTAMATVDTVLAALDPKKVGIAYPSFRHRES